MATIAVDTFGAYAGAGADASSEKTAETKGPRDIPTRASVEPAANGDLKKKLDQLDKLVDKNKKNAESLTDEDVDGFWDRLKTRLKNGQGTSSGEGNPEEKR
jgi:hypothetical protein